MQPRGDAHAQAEALARYVAALPALSLELPPVRDHIGAMLSATAIWNGRPGRDPLLVSCIDRLMQEHPDPTLSAFRGLLSASDVQILLERGWDDRDVLPELLSLSRLLTEARVQTPGDLRAWLLRRNNVLRVGGARSMTPERAVYLGLSAGITGLVPIDRHLTVHLARAGIGVHTTGQVCAVLDAAAPILGVSPDALGWGLWIWSQPPYSGDL